MDRSEGNNRLHESEMSVRRRSPAEPTTTESEGNIHELSSSNDKSDQQPDPGAGFKEKGKYSPPKTCTQWLALVTPLLVTLVGLAGGAVGAFGETWRITSDAVPDFEGGLWTYRATLDRKSRTSIDIYVDSWSKIPDLEAGLKWPMVGLLISFLVSICFLSVLLLLQTLRIWVHVTTPTIPLSSHRWSVIKLLVELQQSHVIAVGLLSFNSVALAVSMWILLVGAKEGRKQYTGYLVRHAIGESSARQVHYHLAAGPWGAFVLAYLPGVILQLMGVMTSLNKGRHSRLEREGMDCDGKECLSSTSGEGDTTRTQVRGKRRCFLAAAAVILDEPEVLWDR